MDKFEFFEVVKIISSSNPETKHCVGRVGFIFGKTPIAEDENGVPDYSDVIDYAVVLEGERYSCVFLPDDLESTGEFIDREDYYSDTVSIRVGVDEKGRGFLLDKEPRSEEEAKRRKEMGWV